jgi:hypothetical protein
MGLRAQVASTYARVVSAIQLMVKAVALGIIELTPGFAVLARNCRLTGE